MRALMIALLSLLVACDDKSALSDDERGALHIAAAPLALNLEASRSAEMGRGLMVKSLASSRAAFDEAPSAGATGVSGAARKAAVAAFDAIAKHQVCLGRLKALPSVGADGKGSGSQQAQHRQCVQMFDAFLDHTGAAARAALPGAEKDRGEARATLDAALNGESKAALAAWCHQRPNGALCAALGG